MSAAQYRRQLESKRKDRVKAQKKAGEFRAKESSKRADAGKARVAATKTSNAGTAASKMRESDRRETEAQAAGKEANRWDATAARYLQQEADLQAKLTKAEVAEAAAAEKSRVREQQRSDRQHDAEKAQLELRLRQAESTVENVVRQLPEPRAEKLRVLLLGAASEGDLRIGREQKRIRAAVESALHRDQIVFDLRTAATAGDLLDGITKFRPHIVHFSGHSDDQLIVFEDDEDEPHEGVIVSAAAFRRAIAATDQPPTLVLLNSCNSASQIDELVKSVVPFAIGMADSIEDADAINYAAQFYAAVANGQSIKAAHAAGQARLELDGLDSADLPTLAYAADVAPATVLVTPGESS